MHAPRPRSPALLLAALLLAACPRPVPEGPAVIDCDELLGRFDLGRILARDCEAEAAAAVPAGALSEREQPAGATTSQRNLDRAIAEASDLLALMHEEARELCGGFNRCELADAAYRDRRAALAASGKAVRDLAGRAIEDVGPQGLASRRALAAFLAKEAAAFGGGGRRPPGSCPAHFPEDCGDGSCAPPGAQCCGDGRSCPAGTLCCGLSCCGPGAACGVDGACEGGAFALGCSGGYPVTCPDGACAPAGAACCGGGTFCRNGSCCGAVCCGVEERCDAGRCVSNPGGRSEGGARRGATCSGGAPVTCPDGTCAPTTAHCCGGGKICRSGTCCGESECCSSGQACEDGHCVGPVASSAACDTGFPLTCPDGSCAPGGASCCGSGKFCPAGLACCGESECCVRGELCVDGACVGGGEGAACGGELPQRCPDGTCAPVGADCCDNGKFCRSGSCCGANECCGRGSSCRDGTCVGGGPALGPGGDGPTPCGTEMPLRCPDGSCAPEGAACCGNSKFCRQGSCCGEDDCCQSGEICAGGQCVKGGDAALDRGGEQEPAATL